MRIFLLPRVALMMGAAGIAWASAHAQTPPATLPGTAPLGPAAPIVVAPEVRQILQMLQDRKGTLKDFTSKIDYSVEDRLGEVSGKRGTLSFLMDPVIGATFSADFTVNTKDGKPTLKYHTQFIFDGRDLTIKDFGEDDKRKEFIRRNMLPPGAKPGEAVSLNGALPLPIGIEVDEVLRNFEATLQASKDADRAVLKLVPRKGAGGAKFDYESLVVTVDKKLELPVKLVMTMPGGESVTTIVLDEVKVNTGAAKMLDSATGPGWTERK